MSHLHIRKQVYELTADDLDQHAVWEFALDEKGEERQDEATVRPYEGNQPLNPTDGMFIVRALFVSGWYANARIFDTSRAGRLESWYLAADYFHD
ncbi:hypothetical protein [Synechococcus elongatus]|uniref:hypothetical protein n=1 Tax=Synechococcus elongatus TaxID=32046 RepID=UPI0030CAF85E